MRTTGALTATESAALACVYTHRVAATGQLRAWLGHDAGDGRYLQWCLANLRARGLLANLGRRNRSEWLWHATAVGAAAAEEAHLVVPRRWRLTEAKAAAGFDAAHTLAVNDAATAIRRHFLSIGCECGPLDWQHEVAHHWGKAGTIGGRGNLIADAVIRVMHSGASGQDDVDDTRTERVWFLEMDRATMTLARLVDELRAYADYCDQGSRHWHTVYGPAFPRLLVVLDGLGPAGLERRRTDLIRTVQHRQLLRTGSSTNPWLNAAVVTLDELRADVPPTMIPNPNADRRPWYENR